MPKLMSIFATPKLCCRAIIKRNNDHPMNPDAKFQDASLGTKEHARLKKTWIFIGQNMEGNSPTKAQVTYPPADILASVKIREK